MHFRLISEIPQDEYTLIDQVGSGTFSDIFSATHIKTNTNVALKISLKTNVEEYDKAIDQEVKINKSLHHPFICKFFTEFETEHLNIIVMELIDGMTALDYVNQNHGLPLSEVSNLFSQLLIAIEYLHNEAHITHRDLKLENIMIDNCGHIRLIDFGFSSKNSLMSTLCGSIPYCAPEVLSGQLYTKASDIWSMGIILYSLFDGNLPFFHQNTNTLVSIICNREPKFSQNFDESLRDLLIKMLNKVPEQRIKIDDIKKHPFLSEEKLLQIDYKQLFTPTDTPRNVLQTSKTEQCISGPSLKISRPTKNSNCFSSQVRRSGFFRNTSSAFNLSEEAIEILQEKITLKTDDIDLSIENRKDFAHNLTKLIESAIYKHISHAETVSEGTSLSLMEENQLSLSSSHIVISNNLINLTTNQPGTSDCLMALNPKLNSHHFALTNHFAGLKKKGNEQTKRSKHNARPLPHPIRNGRTNRASNPSVSIPLSPNNAAKPPQPAQAQPPVPHPSHPPLRETRHSQPAITPPPLANNSANPPLNANANTVSPPLNASTNANIITPPLNTNANIVSPPLNANTNTNIVSPPLNANTNANTNANIITPPLNTNANIVSPPLNANTNAVTPSLNSNTNVVAPPLNGSAGVGDDLQRKRLVTVQMPLPSNAQSDQPPDQSMRPQKRKAGMEPVFLSPHYIAKSHRRHSHSRALVKPTPIVAPLVTQPTINLSEE